MKTWLSWKSLNIDLTKVNSKQCNINFYRYSNGNEVDIMYKIWHYVIPIEVKAGAMITKEFYKGLRHLDKIFNEFPYDKVGDINILNIHKIDDFINIIKI